MMRKVYLEDICDIKIGRTPPRKQPQWFSESHGIKWPQLKTWGIRANISARRVSF